MISIDILPHAEKLAPANPLGLERWPLYHQMRTYEALGEHPLVVNTYDTGTGKTVAALLGLLHPALHGRNCLFIAPTNELIRQHVGDIETFVRTYGLDYHVLHVDAATMRSLRPSHERERVGERLVRLFSNPRAFGWEGRKPVIVVTNPDIFYYALYVAAYNPHDRRNLLEQFLSRFDYVVVDEFHYYNAKQLANFLFFFIIAQEWGYFDQGRRICLLSATPEEAVAKYLSRVFPKSNAIAWISPGNKPADSADCEVTPVLAPLTLTVQAGTIDEFAEDTRQRAWLSDLLAAGQDGALISNALWRVNQARAKLKGVGFDGRVSRLTGAETIESRRIAPSAPLILATPTVDIGYNFSKPGKVRQPLDFIVFDARTRDEFLQRLGRAGRVLGRAQTDLRSQAVALVDADALAGLKHLAGQGLARPALRQAIQQVLPPRHDLFAYIRSYAVWEAFRPIYELKRTMRPDLEEWVERLFDGVRQVFAPDSQRWYYGSLCGRIRRHERIGRVLQDELWGELPDFVDDFLNWHRPMNASPEEWTWLEQEVRSNPSVRKGVMLPWMEAHYALDEALFSFRDSFQGPVAAVYDPTHLLSDADVTEYDALHVAANFEADYFDGVGEFQRACGVEADEKAQVYCRLKAQREARLAIGLTYREQRLPRDAWERLYTGRPVALRGLHLLANALGGGAAPLPTALQRSLESSHVACLVVADKDWGRLLYLTRDRNLFPRALSVTFVQDGGLSHDYKAMVGAAAFVVHAELERYFWIKEKREATAPIIV
ncbi:MAG: type I-D CRISPR-associated helicase Cas3' [Caldilineales bacterium]|nr:type I-D CRISPR-associated helicase Cas3' [Caldilineales bacterium]MCW5858975.1 type I-D CRISPR-associated helicase Cas3' [Caldilineales bacterium]